MVVEKITREPKYVSRRRRFSVEANQTINWLLITLTALIVVLSSSYILLKSKSAQQVYLLTDIQKNRTKLQSESESLNAKLVEALSFQTLEGTKQVKNMSETESKTFVERPKKKKT